MIIHQNKYGKESNFNLITHLNYESIPLYYSKVIALIDFIKPLTKVLSFYNSANNSSQYNT